MNYIIFKADGSINEKKLAYYIQQGNTGVDTIFVSKADIEDEGSYTCQAFFKMPNGTTNTLAGVWTASVEYKTGVFANGWMITLTTNQTTYNGLLQMSVSLLLSSSNLLTYPVALVINETGYQPDADSGVTIEEINSYLVQLQSYQLKYDLANVRGYNTLALATADLPNLADGQIVIIRDGGSSIYQVQAGELVDLTVNKATSDSLGNVIKDSYVSAVYPTYNTTTDKLFIETYSVEDVLMANNEVILPKATTTKNGLMAKEDKVKVDALATTYETIVNSDAKIKVIGGYFTDVADAFNQMSNSFYKFYVGSNGNYYPHLAIRSSTLVLVLSAGGVRSYSKSGTTWTLRTYATQDWVNTQLATKQSTSEKGQPNGYASLDSGGKVPTAQLPSYVDDVLEFANLASFPATGSASVIYVALDTNLTYRWSGSAYVEISPSLALGETAETAYRGDRGKTAYDHSQLVSGNPHNVTKADIGLTTTDVGTYKNLEIDTAEVQVASAVGDSAGNDITTTYATKTEVADIEAVIPANATALNPLIARSDSVKIMQAPASTTLTDSEMAQIIEGRFINGTFLGVVNPVLCPATLEGSYYRGMVLYGNLIRAYQILISTKVISMPTTSTPLLFLGSIGVFNGKIVPAFPESSTGSYINKYVNGTWQWSLEAPAPSVVSLNLETILAGTDVNFSCSGSGTSESPYIIMPKENIPHRYNRYQLTANTEPANDIYITLQANGLEKCQVEVTHATIFSTHHYYVTVLDNNGNARVRISSANTISRAIWDVSGTKFIITLDVNGDNVYYETSIA